MMQFLESLLDLDRLRLGDQGVTLGFERPMPAWAWGLSVAAALTLAMWSYSRLVGPRSVRIALGGVRALVLMILVVLVSGPQLVQRSESVENDWVLVLVDRSASMTIADVPDDDRGARRSRQAQLDESLRESWPMWRQLSEQRVVVWLGFDSGAYDLDVRTNDTGQVQSLSMGEASGQRTRIGASLEQALARAAARPLAAVVIFSDGRSSDQLTRAAMRRLQADRVPVISVPLGSAEPVGDLAVRRADAPRIAFVDDRTPIRVEIERIGAEGAGQGGLVRVLDRATGLVLDERRVEWQPGQTSQDIVLLTRAEEEGDRNWVVEIVPDEPDLVAQNNRVEVSIELVDRPLRVLYIDGYPRWEQRYIKNLLVREDSITSSALLLAPDRRYIQEGEIVIDFLPVSPEEWAEFDAVIIGDVRPEVFTSDQLAVLREHVARRGGGLIWVGGEGSTPTAWFDTPLGDLLPFYRDAYDERLIPEPVVMRPTPIAERLGLLQLGDTTSSGWPPELSDPNEGWSLLRWSQSINPMRLKPATQVLAEAVPEYATASDQVHSPLVMSMRYGAGRSLYVATDETWRWRYARGEKLPERFWLQMVRLLGRESLARSGKSATLEMTPVRAQIDQPVRIEVELLDQEIVAEKLPSMSVTLRRRNLVPGEGHGGASVEILLRPEGEGYETYSALWLPDSAGTWVAQLNEAALANLNLEGQVLVSLPDDELRRPETDHDMLSRLSQETGGVVLQPTDLRLLPDQIPNRKRLLLNERSEALWDTPLALLLVVGLLTIEWVVRRLIRLV